jgi:hypothetical protein
VKIEKACEQVLKKVSASLEVVGLRQVVKHLEQKLQMLLQEISSLVFHPRELRLPCSLSLGQLLSLEFCGKPQHRLRLLHGRSCRIFILRQIEASPSRSDFDDSPDYSDTTLALTKRFDQEWRHLALRELSSGHFVASDQQWPVHILRDPRRLQDQVDHDIFQIRQRRDQLNGNAPLF